MKERIIGHRGYGVIAPENTLSALDYSAKLGLRYVEFDIRLTRDNIIVVSHDDSLARCAGDSRLISQTDFADLQDVNVAKTHAAASAPEKLPTLQEYIQKAYDLGLVCQIELKPNESQMQTLVDLAAQEISAFYDGKDENVQPLITSFSPVALKSFFEKSALPFQRGILLKVEDISAWKEIAAQAQCDYVHVNVIYLTQELADSIKAAGYKINAYHLNHIELAGLAVEKGCERFTCDVPDVFVAQIKNLP